MDLTEKKRDVTDKTIEESLGHPFFNFFIYIINSKLHVVRTLNEILKNGHFNSQGVQRFSKTKF